MELFCIRAACMYSQAATATTDSGIILSYLPVCSSTSDGDIVSLSTLKAALLLPLDVSLWKTAIELNRSLTGLR
jgi:hypothetical protein